MSDTTTLQLDAPTLAVGITFFISLVMFIFMYLKFRTGQADWRILVVVGCETINYLLALSLEPDQLYIPLSNGGGFTWFRYVMWAITCPILIQMILGVLTESKADLDTVSKLMVTNILMDLMGATAEIYQAVSLKVTALIVAFLCFFYMYYVLVTVWQSHRKMFMTDTQRMRRDVLVVMLSSWLVFPVLFLIGPPVAGLISVGTSVAAHCVGDLIAKNLVGFVSWKLRQDHAKAQREAEASADGLSGSMRKPHPIKLNDFDANAKFGHQLQSATRNGSLSGDISRHATTEKGSYDYDMEAARNFLPKHTNFSSRSFEPVASPGPRAELQRAGTVPPRPNFHQDLGRERASSGSNPGTPKSRSVRLMEQSAQMALQALHTAQNPDADPAQSMDMINKSICASPSLRQLFAVDQENNETAQPAQVEVKIPVEPASVSPRHLAGPSGVFY